MTQDNKACLVAGELPVASQLTFITPNTKVRLITAHDQALYLELYTDANIMRFIGKLYTKERVTQSFFHALKLTALSPWERLFFVIESNCRLQSFGLMGLTNTGDAGVEFGIMLRQQVQGKGLASEVLQQCIARLFALGVSKVWLQLHPDNAAAIAMAQAAAMTKLPGSMAENQQIWFIEQQHDKNCRRH